MSERGSVSVVVAVAIAMAAVSAALSADLGIAARGAAQAQAAADAAALAAAQELVLPSGPGGPEQVARRYAERHGAELVRCRCPPEGDDVLVVVERQQPLPFLGGGRTIRRAARAVLSLDGDVLGLEGDVLGLEPRFASRLACLAARVPGLWIVSGFRTRGEQARLHREKPDLAAPPGRSMHQRGLAADLGFPSPAARSAAHRAAGSCRLTFPIPHEPWHAEPA